MKKRFAKGKSKIRIRCLWKSTGFRICKNYGIQTTLGFKFEVQHIPNWYCAQLLCTAMH